MNRASKLAFLEKKVQGAVSIITDTISALEKTNTEYENERVSIQLDIIELQATADSVTEKIAHNNKLLQNFRKIIS